MTDMINSIGVQNSSLLAKYKSQEKVTNPIQENVQPQTNEVASKEAADAMKAYVIGGGAGQRELPLTFEEYKDSLIKQGKVEGKDFNAESENYKAITLLDNQNRPIKRLHWDTQDRPERKYLESYEVFSYPENNDIEKSIMCYDGNNNYAYKSVTYKSGDKCPYPDEVIKYGTGADEYIKTLEEKNIKYKKIEDTSAGNQEKKDITLLELNEKDEPVKEVKWYYNNNQELVMLQKSLNDKKVSLYFNEDGKVDVTDYN